MAGHDNKGGQNVMGKTCHKHVMLVFYGRNEKIRSMGNKIIVVSRRRKRKRKKNELGYSSIAVT